MPTVALLFSIVMGIFIQENSWNILADVSFKKTTDVNGYEVDAPVFGEKVKGIQGKQIQLKGYIVPGNEWSGEKSFMFSALPFSTCYFCGGAGPETVIEVESLEKITFTTKPIVITGKLVLNERDPEHHIYLLKGARLKSNS
jgi:hypothetical protein